MGFDATEDILKRRTKGWEVLAPALNALDQCRLAYKPQSFPREYLYLRRGSSGGHDGLQPVLILEPTGE